MYDFLRTAEQMLAIPSVTNDGTARLAEYLLETVIPDLPGDAVALAEPDGRDVNLLVVVPGKGEGRPLLLNSHLDTVPPGEASAWTATGGDPFRPRLEGDRLIGLGSADAKLDWLCKAEALRRSAGSTSHRPIHLLGTYGEERGLVGARRALERGTVSGAGMALVGEPTECQLVTQHKGLLIAQLHLAALSRELPQVVLGSRMLRYAGRSAHSATPEYGDSAILKALSALRDEAPVVAIRGGDAPNKVPAWCEVEVAVSRRGRKARQGAEVTRPNKHLMSPALLAAARDFAGALLVLAERGGGQDSPFSPPGLTVNISHVDGRGETLTLTFDLRSVPGADGRTLRAWLDGAAAELERAYAGVRARIAIERDDAALAPAPSELVDKAVSAMAAVGLPGVIGTKAGCTEAGLYAAAGIPAVVFGPGRAADNIHAPNEWTSIRQLRQAVDFYAAFIERYCGQD